MKLGRWLGRCQRVQLRADCGLAGLQFGQPRLQRIAPGALLDGPHQTLQSAFRLSQVALQLRAPRPGLAFLGCQVVREPANKFRHLVWRQQPISQCFQDPCLDPLAGDAGGIVAGAASAPGGAAVAVLADDRETAITAAAGEQAAQQENPSVRPVQRLALSVAADLDAHLSLPRFGCIPDIVVDDPQFGDLGDLPCRGIVHTCNPLPVTRILHIAATVPFQPTDVKGVAQDTRPTIDLAADGRVDPGTATRTWDPLLIQDAGDLSCRLSTNIIAENTTNGGCFVFADAAFASIFTLRRWRHDIVAISETAGDTTRACPAHLSPAGLLTQVREGHLRHHSQDTDVHLRDLSAQASRVDLDAVEAQPVVEIRDIGQSATEPVDRFANENVKAPAFRIS